MSEPTKKKLKEATVITENTVDLAADHLLVIDNSDSGTVKRVIAGSAVFATKTQTVENKRLKNCSIVVVGDTEDTELEDVVTEHKGIQEARKYYHATDLDLMAAGIDMADIITALGLDPDGWTVPIEGFHVTGYSNDDGNNYYLLPGDDYRIAVDPDTNAVDTITFIGTPPEKSLAMIEYTLKAKA